MKPHFLRPVGLLFLMLLLSAQLAWTQNTGEGVWEEEDDDEDSLELVEDGPVDAPVEEEVKRYEDVLIRINGKELKMEAEYHTQREETLDIQVRQLAPGSSVIIEVKKGGINFKRKVFYANNKGELDLEVRVGTKKVSGDAVLYYTPKGNEKKTLDVKIVVE